MSLTQQLRPVETIDNATLLEEGVVVNGAIYPDNAEEVEVAQRLAEIKARRRSKRATLMEEAYVYSLHKESEPP